MGEGISMKILQINSFFSVGGPPRIVNGIYDTLVELGYECKIAAAREMMYAPKNSIRIGSNLGVRINALKSRLFDNEGFSAKRATKKLIKEIEEYNPDVIHLHNLHGYYINLEILFNYLKTAGKPVVWTLHDCWSITGHCAHFDYIGCDKWKTTCESCPQIKEYPKSIFKDNSYRNYKKKKAAFCGVNNMTLAPVSKWLEGILKQSFLAEYPTEVSYNGIDLEAFFPRASTLKEKLKVEDKKVLLGVAQNWGVKKGLADFKLLYQSMDKTKYALVLIGLPEEQQKEMPEGIICVDQTNCKEELAEYYSIADVFLNLSYEETFGLVTLEALACGTPVVVYDRTAVPEIVEKDCGEVVAAGNIEELLQKIDIVDKSSRTEACVKKAQEFDYKKSYQKYVQLYERLCGLKD